MHHLIAAVIWTWQLCVFPQSCDTPLPPRCVISQPYHSRELCERDRAITLDMMSRTQVITAGFSSCERQ